MDTTYVPVKTVRVRRNGKNITPALNEPFEFTAEEVDDIKRLSPDSIRPMIVEEAPVKKKGKKGEEEL